MDGQAQPGNPEENSQKTEADAPVNLLVGHNALVFNRHVEVLNILERFNQESIMLHLSLSYGNVGAEKSQTIPERSRSMPRFFSLEKVWTQEELVDKWTYDRFLASMDVAVLGAPRQNALGNIIRLFYMGKKVYLAPITRCMRFLMKKDFTSTASRI